MPRPIAGPLHSSSTANQANCALVGSAVLPSDLPGRSFCSTCFIAAKSICHRTIPKISRASTIPGWRGSVSRQRAAPRIHTPLKITALPVPVATINRRGENHLRSGTSGKSKNFHVWIFPCFLYLRRVKFRPKCLVNRFLHFQFPECSHQRVIADLKLDAF